MRAPWSVLDPATWRSQLPKKKATQATTAGPRGAAVVLFDDGHEDEHGNLRQLMRAEHFGKCHKPRSTSPAAGQGWGMLKRALPFTWMIAVVLASCGSPSDPSGFSTRDGYNDPCNGRVEGLKVEGSPRMSLKVGDTRRVTFDVGTPAHGCPQAIGPFERLFWYRSAKRVVNVRLVDCRDCQVKYTDRVVTGGGGNDLEGSALIYGEQAVVFEVTGLAPGMDLVTVSALRRGETATAFLEVESTR